MVLSRKAATKLRWHSFESQQLYSKVIDGTSSLVVQLVALYATTKLSLFKQNESFCTWDKCHHQLKCLWIMMSFHKWFGVGIKIWSSYKYLGLEKLNCYWRQGDKRMLRKYIKRKSPDHTDLNQIKQKVFSLD